MVSHLSPAKPRFVLRVIRTFETATVMIKACANRLVVSATQAIMKGRGKEARPEFSFDSVVAYFMRISNGSVEL